MLRYFSDVQNDGQSMLDDQGCDLAASRLAGVFGALGAAEAKGGNLFQSPCMSHFNGLGCSTARGIDTLKNGPNAATNGQAATGNAGVGGGMNRGAQ